MKKAQADVKSYLGMLILIGIFIIVVIMLYLFFGSELSDLKNSFGGILG